MGQLSAELNYERRLWRYEEETEEHILGSEDWEEELEHHLEEATKEEKQEQEKGKPEDGSNEEYKELEEYTVVLVPADLAGYERFEGEAFVEGKYEIPARSLALLEKLRKGEEEYDERLFPVLEMGDYLRGLVIEGIEGPIEPIELEGLEGWMEEDIHRELEREERRQDELGREVLFEETVRSIIKKESEAPLERLFEGYEELREVKGPREYELIEEREKSEEGLREHLELPEEELIEPERLIEELAEEEFEEPVGELEKEEYREILGLEALEKLEEYEGEIEASEELEGVEERVEGLIEEAEGVEEFEEVEEERAEEVEKEEVEEKEEEIGEAAEAGEEKVEGEELAEDGEGGGRPPRAVAAGEEGPEEEPHVKSTVNWDELPDEVALRVDQEKLRELVEKARRKAGSATALKKEGIMDQRIQVEILKGKMDVITVRKLKELLDFLGIAQEEVNPYIKGIGSRTHPDKIRKPHIPFDFNSEEGAFILAAALKDGYVFAGRRLRFEYSNKDRENIERIKRAGRKVFGDVEPYERKLPGGTCTITYHSSAIAGALMRMGIPAGRKTEQKYYVPKVILRGSKNIQRAYWYQTMMDEGSWSCEEPYIRYNQASSLSVKGLSEEEREYIDKLLTEERELPSGYCHRFVLINKDLKGKIEKEYPNLWRAIEESEPPYLEEEASMLERICGAELEPKPVRIYTVEGGKYRVIWEIETRSKVNFEKIMKGLGLPKEKHGQEED